nr:MULTISPECIES: KUP/HAK/KT family potassium transporter [Kocuria]
MGARPDRDTLKYVMVVMQTDNDGEGGVLSLAALTRKGVPTRAKRWDLIMMLGVIGAEALYADMGHFGRKPINQAWFFLVFPSLLLNYMGQGSLILGHPETVNDSFYLLAPGWARLPLVVLATMATVIASQSVISGAFSSARQAERLGYLPHMTVRHTGQHEEGQI